VERKAAHFPSEVIQAYSTDTRALGKIAAEESSGRKEKGAGVKILTTRLADSVLGLRVAVSHE